MVTDALLDDLTPSSGNLTIQALKEVQIRCHTLVIGSLIFTLGVPRQYPSQRQRCQVIRLGESRETRELHVVVHLILTRLSCQQKVGLNSKHISQFIARIS